MRSPGRAFERASTALDGPSSLLARGLAPHSVSSSEQCSLCAKGSEWGSDQDSNCGRDTRSPRDFVGSPSNCGATNSNRPGVARAVNHMVAVQFPPAVLSVRYWVDSGSTSIGGASCAILADGRDQLAIETRAPLPYTSRPSEQASRTSANEAFSFMDSHPSCRRTRRALMLVEQGRNSIVSAIGNNQVKMPVSVQIRDRDRRRIRPRTEE